jgi:hypothetical protein
VRWGVDGVPRWSISYVTLTVAICGQHQSFKMHSVDPELGFFGITVIIFGVFLSYHLHLLVNNTLTSKSTIPYAPICPLCGVVWDGVS